MKILRIASTMDPRSGGVAESIFQMSRAARDLGTIVEVVSLDDPGSDFIATSDVVIHALGKGILNYRLQPRLLVWLLKNAKKYDAIIIDGIWQFHSLAAHAILILLGRPYFIFTHGMLDPWFKHTYPLKHLKKSLYWLLGDYWVLRHAKGVLFTCEEERMLARQSFSVYRANEVVVNFGTARPSCDLDFGRAQFFLRHPDLEKKKIILFLSRIQEKKGLDLLITAFARTMKNRHEYQLVIAGPGEKTYLESLYSLAENESIADRISWLGMLTGDEKWSAFASANIFALTSHQENFGIVVAEAMACGKPVLISNKVNIWREIEDTHSGFVADDTLSGVEKLLTLYLQLSADDYTVMANNAADCFSDNFEITKAVGALLEVLASP